MISDAIAAHFDETVFPGGLTYCGHPLAAASIVGALDAMADEGIVDNARRIGAEVLGPGLAELADEAPGHGRGARPRCLLGPRAGRRPRRREPLCPRR